MITLELTICLVFGAIIGFIPMLFFKSKYDKTKKIKMYAHSQYNYVGLAAVLAVFIFTFFQAIFEFQIKLSAKEVLVLFSLFGLLSVTSIYYYSKNVRLK